MAAPSPPPVEAMPPVAPKQPPVKTPPTKAAPTGLAPPKPATFSISTPRASTTTEPREADLLQRMQQMEAEAARLRENLLKSEAEMASLRDTLARTTRVSD
jgi:molecular chaperone GrpE (heat shock protein)